MFAGVHCAVYVVNVVDFTRIIVHRSDSNTEAVLCNRVDTVYFYAENGIFFIGVRLSSCGYLAEFTALYRSGSDTRN